MSRVLILGGGGMLGHKAYQVLSCEHDVRVTFRTFDERLQRTGLFDQRMVMTGVDATDVQSVRAAIEAFAPAVVLNCVGVIKQLAGARNPKIAIEINALFPHVLAEVCARADARLIHVSTDCVFSGRGGHYRETDESDAHDLYGRTKFLGETGYGNCVTLRTSIIGHELFSCVSLVDWFLAQRQGTIRGFKRAIYTGFPTVVFCRELSRVITKFPDLSGLFHVAAPPISKYELLQLVGRIYGASVTILPDEEFRCDRSLDGHAYEERTGFQSVPWPDMVDDMHKDFVQYYRWKST